MPPLSPPSPHLPPQPPAPAQDVARRILGEDVTQIEVYTERVKRMVGKDLTGNGITRYDQGAYGLVGGEARGGSASPSGCLGPLSTSEIQCLAVTRERTAMRS